MEQNMEQKTQSSTGAGSEYLRGQAECAKYMRVSRRCISEWQARRIIPYIKIGKKCVLFRKRDIDAALTRYEVKAV